KKPAVVEHRTFDPAHPPADMPALKANEAAVTQALFNCAVESSYRIDDRRRHDGRCSVSATITSVKMTVELKIVIWLPRNATEKLKAHEEGHRRINEQIYGDAERIARTVTQRLDGKQIAAEGEDCSKAEKQAVEAATG